MGLTGTWILIAVLIGTGGSSRPVPIVAEFGSKAACEAAKESIRIQAKGVDFITCEKK